MGKLNVFVLFPGFPLSFFFFFFPKNKTTQTSPPKKNLFLKAEEEKLALKAKPLRQVSSIDSLAKSAANRSAIFDRENGSLADSSGPGYNVTKDNSKRAFFSTFRNVVSQSDVLLFVLDARDPMGTRCKAVEEMVMTEGGRKRIVLVLNKIDLVPREAVESWLKWLREELPCVAFKASTQEQRTGLSQKSGNAILSGSGSECLGMHI